jgi:hypothetical protein
MARREARVPVQSSLSDGGVARHLGEARLASPRVPLPHIDDVRLGGSSPSDRLPPTTVPEE